MKSRKDQSQKTKSTDALVSWDDLLAFDTRQEKLEHEAQLLMFSFLSEIEQHRELAGLTRKELAAKMGTSAPYLSQLYKANKPVNFLTLAKAQDALHLRFKVAAEPVGKTVRKHSDSRLWTEIIRHAVDGDFRIGELEIPDPKKNLYDSSPSIVAMSDDYKKAPAHVYG